jgi:hypothetical protein
MMPGAVDTTAQDVFVLIGLGAANTLIWLTFDKDFQEWRRGFDLRRSVDKVWVAIEEDLACTREWNEERRRRKRT